MGMMTTQSRARMSGRQTFEALLVSLYQLPKSQSSKPAMDQQLRSELYNLLPVIDESMASITANAMENIFAMQKLRDKVDLMIQEDMLGSLDSGFKLVSQRLGKAFVAKQLGKERGDEEGPVELEAVYTAKEDQDLAAQVALAWTDGSIMRDRGRTTGGSAVHFKPLSPHNASLFFPYPSSSTECELNAFILALRKLKENNIKNVIIFTDSIAAIATVKVVGRGDEISVPELQQANIRTLENFRTKYVPLADFFSGLTFCYVRSHTNDEGIVARGNAFADEAAKAAARSLLALLTRT